MFENLIGFFKKINKKEGRIESKTNKDEAKERLHLVLMQDRANVSADFLDMMRQEIIDVIKKYIDVDESDIDVRLTNKQNGDGTTGAPALYANIPIKSIKNETIKNNDTNNDNKNENVEQKNDNNKKEDELLKESNGQESDIKEVNEQSDVNIENKEEKNLKNSKVEDNKKQEQKKELNKKNNNKSKVKNKKLNEKK